jgi:hypothetical protein
MRYSNAIIDKRLNNKKFSWGGSIDNRINNFKYGHELFRNERSVPDRIHIENKPGNYLQFSLYFAISAIRMPSASAFRS